MTERHRHQHTTSAAGQRTRLVAVLAITVTVLVAEVVGGILTNSLVLLADAGHMASDAAGIGLALAGIWFGTRPETPQRTFGYQRAEILAAVVNAVLLFGVGGYILVEAVRRLFEPPEVGSGLMVVFGLVALAGNTVSLSLLWKGQRESLTVHGAFLEVASDALGAVAVIVAALFISVTGFARADAVASLLIGALILPRTWRLLREAIEVLLESTPRGVDIGDIRRHIAETPGVVGCHDLHAWTITSGVPVLSAHVVVTDRVLADGTAPQLLDQLQECLASHFDLAHCTFQLEPAGHADHERAGHP